MVWKCLIWFHLLKQVSSAVWFQISWMISEKFPNVNLGFDFFLIQYKKNKYWSINQNQFFFCRIHCSCYRHYMDSSIQSTIRLKRLHSRHMHHSILNRLQSVYVRLLVANTTTEARVNHFIWSRMDRNILNPFNITCMIKLDIIAWALCLDKC